MNKEDIKIKYLIGSFRDDPGYPSIEDFFFLIENWFYHERGKDFIHLNRGIEETGKPCFTDSILEEKLNGDKEISNSLIQNLLDRGLIELIKETRFNSYYSFV